MVVQLAAVRVGAKADQLVLCLVGWLVYPLVALLVGSLADETVASLVG